MGVSKLLGVAASIAIAFAMQNAEHVAPETMENSLSKKQDAAPLKMMLVGDSITHGFEADTTWRFRLWEWLKSTNTPFNFVGPYTGKRDTSSAVDKSLTFQVSARPCLTILHSHHD